MSEDLLAPRPDASPQHRTSSRRNDIQGLRALAVLMVVAFHAGISVPGGFMGVDVFFVISGFVITAMLLRQLDGGGFTFGRFYTRRARRILPASALAISVTALASIAAISPLAQSATARTGASGSLFFANVVLARNRNGYFDINPTSNPLLHIWSLSVEEQFYLVFPALLLLGFALVTRRRRRGNDSRRPLALLVGLTMVGSFLLSWYFTYHNFTVSGTGETSRMLRKAFPKRTVVDGAQLAFYLAPMRAWEFAAGALIALAVPQICRLPARAALWVGVVGVAIVAYAAFHYSDTTPFPGYAALVPVVGTVLLIMAGTIGTNGVSAAFSVRPLTKIGDVSYSWYLWHWPLIVFAAALFPTAGHAALFGAAISILPAWLSYRYMENPIRSNERIRGWRVVTVVAVCVAVPVACSFVLAKAPKPSRSAATRLLLATRFGGAPAQSLGCGSGRRLRNLPDGCTWSVDHPKGRVVLLGDSNASHFIGPARAAANGLGYDFTMGTFEECPFIDIFVDLPLQHQTAEKCRNFVSRSLTDLRSIRPKLVLLAASSPLYMTNDTTFHDPLTGATATSPAAKARLWTVGLHRVVQTLADAHVPVVVLSTVPQWPSWALTQCAEIRIYLAPRSCGTSESVASVASYRHLALAAEAQALRGVPSATAVDFVDDLCPKGRCATNRGNFWLYNDGMHLSVRGAALLKGPFRELVQAHAAA